MPSATGSVQPTCSFGVFSTSTRHMRQAACSVRPFVIAERRDLDAAFLAASISSVPFGLDRLAVDCEIYQFSHCLRLCQLADTSCACS